MPESSDFEWDCPPSVEVGSISFAFGDRPRKVACFDLAKKVKAMEALVLRCLHEEHDHHGDRPCLRCMADNCVTSWTSTFVEHL